MSGTYPSHWEPARAALTTLTVPIKTVSEEGFDNDACEYNVTENIMVVELLTPAYCKVLIAFYRPTPLAVHLVVCEVIVVVW